VVENARTVLAIELLVAAQALDARAPLLAGAGVRKAHAIVRRYVPHMDEDRELHRDISAVAGALEEIVAATRA